jgi:hypothetical protein
MNRTLKELIHVLLFGFLKPNVKVSDVNNQTQGLRKKKYRVEPINCIDYNQYRTYETKNPKPLR